MSHHKTKNDIFPNLCGIHDIVQPLPTSQNGTDAYLKNAIEHVYISYVTKLISLQLKRVPGFARVKLRICSLFCPTRIWLALALKKKKKKKSCFAFAKNK